jgi:predicted DNA-binding helix-hairpin-helix protein
VYYSAFVPVAPDPRLPILRSPPLVREHRLYQADWLIRFYGFQPEEILDSGEANLSADLDPKSAWALRHPEFFPVDIDRADYAELLRVPGVGVTGAGRIVTTRRSGRIRAEDLPKLGIVMKRARYFLSAGGRPIDLCDPGALRSSLVAGDSAQGAVDPAPEGMSSTAPKKAKPQLEFSFA